MKTQLKEIYKCDFCNKLYQVKKAAEVHELLCTKNTVNDRPCYTCEHIGKRNTTIPVEHCMGGEGERVLNLLHCTAKNI